MATYEPDIDLFRLQLESLRNQTDERWICVISDDCTASDRFRKMREVVEDDPRFELSRSGKRLGPYRNFERALEMAPSDAELLAFADQDDRWYPDKLARTREALGSARLVYSDQRLIDSQGRVLRGSLWHGRRNNYTNMASMLVANTIPGAAMLFTREVKELALPFPSSPAIHYHDHWLALVALASGRIAYVDQPLYDYVQHAAAVQGHLVDRRRSRANDGSRGLRSAYFGGYVPRQLLAQTLLLRCDKRLTPRKRRALEWFIGSGSSPADFMWLAARPLRRLVSRDETLGGESALVRGILWRWLLPVAVKVPHRQAEPAYDASFPDPPRFEQPRLRRWRAGG
jgi:glycosyltransferase involved in cell wall biosynthesis